jgi:hypothetical protein
MLNEPPCYISNSNISDGEKAMSTAKDEATKIIARLPEEASWDEIIYKFYVKRKIEEGLKAADQGRTVPHEKVKELFEHQ